MALTFDVGMNERQAVQSAKNLTKAVDGVDKSLDDLAKNDFGKNVDKGSDRAKDGVKGLGEEAQQTSREMAASFDGSIESIGDGLQELAANGFATLGPAGVAAGAAVALAFGTALNAITEANEALDESRNSMYEFAVAASSSNGVIDFNDRVKELTGSVEKLKEIQDIATVSGYEQKDVLNALATGNGMPALIEAYNEGAASTSIATSRSLELTNVLQGTAEGLALAREGTKLQAGALSELGKYADDTGQKFDAFGQKIDAVDGKTVTVTVQANLAQAYADVDAFVANSNRRRIGIHVGANGVDQVQ